MHSTIKSSLPNNHIWCYHHCGNRVCSLEIPLNCQVCRQPMLKDVPVVQVSSPLVNSATCCTVLLKRSVGFFDLACDILTLDYHIGVSSSCGNVYSLDQCGLILEPPSKWFNSITVFSIDDLSDSKRSFTYWDKALEKFSLSYEVHWNCYNAISNNCFDFVLRFLRSLFCSNLRCVPQYLTSKEQWVELIIARKLRRLHNYISVCRAVNHNKFTYCTLPE